MLAKSIYDKLVSNKNLDEYDTIITQNTMSDNLSKKLDNKIRSGRKRKNRNKEFKSRI